MIPDSEDEFFGLPDTTPEAEKVGGLVVGERARQIFDKAGLCVFDELTLMEAEYRKEGRAPIVFEDSDDTPDVRGQRGP
jgi:hypothetical protein